jgi:hypothetical protein
MGDDWKHLDKHEDAVNAEVVEQRLLCVCLVYVLVW